MGYWMDFEFRQREKEGVVILDLTGRLTFGPADATFREHLQSLFDSGKNKVIVNLGDVSTIDTAAVGTLTVWAQKFLNAGGRLVLLHVLPSHAALHDILRLDTAFQTYAEEVDAVNSFVPHRAVPHYDLLEFLKEESEHHKADREAENETA
jgi:anti-sigma B factor antagonist